jgi:rhodanese-related sulfurtransferase
MHGIRFDTGLKANLTAAKTNVTESIRRENFMRKLILIALLAAATILAQTGAAPKQGAAQGKAAPSKAKVLNRAELDDLLSHPDRILLLDLRRPDEVSKIGGFPVYLSIQIGDLEKHLSEIPKDRIIVTVSNHANRAGRAADILGSKGFKVAGAVGAETYESQGGTLLKIEPPKQAAEKQ